MTPSEAAQLLEIDPNAIPEQIEARFLELRRKLEDRIAKAPTPGLQAKYRTSLAEVTTAFETLTLAADGSSLPVLQPRAAGPAAADSDRATAVAPAAPETAPTTATTPAPRAKAQAAKSNREFVVVAVLAVVLLGGGGWWVVKTRAEKAEQAQLAHEAQLAKEAAEQAEADRLEKLSTQLRSQMAELNVAYNAQVRVEALAERELSDLKAQEREALRVAAGNLTPEVRALSARMRAQQGFVKWLHDTLPAHPATFARARAEELLSARAFDEAGAAVSAFDTELQNLQTDLAAARADLVVTGPIALQASHPGVQWKLTDAFGFTFSGTAPATLNDVALGKATVVFSHAPWPDQTLTAEVKREGEAELRATFLPATLQLALTPATATASIAGVSRDDDGTWTLPPGVHQLEVTHPDFAPQYLSIEAKPGAELRREIVLNEDYGTPALHLARQRLAEVTSNERFFSLAGSLASELQKEGDAAGAKALVAAVLKRPPEGLAVDYLDFSLLRTACSLGLTQETRDLVALWDRLIAEKRVGFADDRFKVVMSLRDRAAALVAVGDSAAAQTYLDQVLAHRPEDREPEEFRRANYQLFAGDLAIRGFEREARVWAGKARAMGGAPHELEGLDKSIDRMEAKVAIRQNRAADAIAALRRVIAAELAYERRIWKDRKPQVYYHMLYSAAFDARLAGADDVADQLRAYIGELEAADLTKDPSPGQKNREMTYQLLDPDLHRKKGEQVRAEQAQVFHEAVSESDPAESVKKLLKLRSDLRFYQIDF